METLLISLHPRHSQNIFSKKKTIELRKRCPRVGKKFKINEPGTASYSPSFEFILIYETTPTAKIVGFCTAFEVVRQSPELWAENYNNSLCLTREEIFSYLRDEVGGDRDGFGIKLRKPRKITPIPLSTMRELGIVPPQSYRYLDDEMIEKLGIKFND